ncbi:MAG TPA: aminotransferase class V-fold PLP-dependent enzyme [Polyangiaceae bacterium]|nr:aminotransferase class V-fold PLP-dependent enzyme [Polyangiaceae bacterium]
MTRDSAALGDAAGAFSPSGNYLNTAAIGLPPRSGSEALHEVVARWSRGEIRANEFDTYVSAARASFARLLGVSPECVATDVAVSSLVGLVAASLPAGAHVLCAEGDFTSVLFPFLERERAGEISVEACPLEAIAERVSARTSLVAVSAVQSADGRVCDLGALEQACRSAGAKMLLDATQAVGWLPLAGDRFDYVVAAAYKWLLSPRGAAFMSIIRECIAGLRPRGAGWYAGRDIWDSLYGTPLRLAESARRFDISPAWFMWLGCAEGLAHIERVGVSAIGAHDLELAALFCERIGRPPTASPIVSVAGKGVLEALAAAGIVASRRGDATRLSFHLYNTRADAIAAADVIRRLR